MEAGGQSRGDRQKKTRLQYGTLSADNKIGFSCETRNENPGTVSTRTQSYSGQDMAFPLTKKRTIFYTLRTDEFQQVSDIKVTIWHTEEPNIWKSGWPAASSRS